MMANQPKGSIFVFVLVVFVTQLDLINADGSVNDSNTLIADLMSGYNTNTRPVDDQSSPVNVTVNLIMKSIQDFNEVYGQFSILGNLVTKWTDPSLNWSPGQYGGLQEVVLPYSSIWVPELVLSSAAMSSNTITQSWNKVVISYTGDVSFVVCNLIVSKCDVNVKYFPFDVQFCQIAFMVPSYPEAMLKLEAENSEVDLNHVQSNVLWDVIGSEISREIADTGEVEMYFGIRLKRKASGVVTVVLLPILMLGMLNVFVFLLVPESGERIGYCVTTLLAIAVYMTIVADMLPQSADPVPIICFKLMVDMIISSMIVVSTILILRVFNKPEDEAVPGWLLKLYYCFKCTRCKQGQIARKNSINVLPAGKDGYAKDGTRSVSVNGFVKPGQVDVEEAEAIAEPNWQEISRFLDWLCFFGYNAGCLISFVVFVLVASTGDGY